MLILLGPRHPRVIDDQEPLRRGRFALGLFALAMFVICFTPTPIDPL
jgi:hypothetical protein